MLIPGSVQYQIVYSAVHYPYRSTPLHSDFFCPRKVSGVLEGSYEVGLRTASFCSIILFCQAEFEMRLRLSCDAEWVKCSSDLALLHSGRVFVIAVDPTALAPGLHYTSIEGEYFVV